MRFEELLESEDQLDIKEAKVIDMHDVSKYARDAIFNPKSKKFFDALFGEEALSFASLTFKHGSQQPIHQDTAFVRVDRPKEFAAIWVALEDVQPESGELMYIPGSHRMPETLFEGWSKWMIRNSPEVSGYDKELVKKAEAAGLHVKRFLPKKGDILIWSHDLAHGGAPNINTEDGVKKTRWSIVSHLCPLSRNPMYFYAWGGQKVKVDSSRWIAAKRKKLQILSEN